MYRLAIASNLLRSDAEVEALRNTHANRAHYEYLVEEDALIIGPDGVIARLVTNCLDPNMVREAAKHFRTVHGDGTNRGSIAGKDSMMYGERVDGSLSFTKGVPLSIVKKMRERNEFTDFLGWMDKSKHGDRFTECRETAWSLESPEVLEAARPFVREVERIYREELPDHWQQQREFVDRTSPDFKFNDSVFSTVTVNRNKRTTYHYDKDDFCGGMGNLVVLDSDGSGALVMPRYRLAFLPRPTDVLLMNVHEMHGNAIFTGERLTTVLYARARIDECGNGKS
jgi:Oxygenase domain of the 2OGFeDO superfamily